ncbi:Oleosin 5 [Forsythia ovata]|uniref:Oleosin 5 n=1 Tax=Forsythia ovata TaxID=205694 RepID=A0ABD1R5P8_9LAMI
MAEGQQLMEASGRRHASGKTVLFASLAGVAIGGPLLGMMGFSFLATLTLLLITSPLLILFSPLIFSAACVVGFAFLGFAVAAAMAIAGMSTVTWVYRSLTGRRAVGYHEGAAGKLVEAGGAGKDWTGYLQQENLMSRAKNLFI